MKPSGLRERRGHRWAGQAPASLCQCSRGV